MRTTVVFIVILLAAGAGWAGDLTPDEMIWLKVCVGYLDSGSERVRDGSAKALEKLGPAAAEPMILAGGTIVTEAGWTALEKILATFGRDEACAALESTRGRWPASGKKRLAAMLEHFRAEGPDAAPPDIEKKVLAELDAFRNCRSYSSNEPGVRRIVMLGRPAVPALVDAIRRGAGGFGPGFYKQAAADALAQLAQEDDLPVLARLLEDGHLVAARAFQRLHGDASLSALIAPLAKGFCDHDLLEALEPYASEKRVIKALITFLDECGSFGGFEIGQVAEFLGKAAAYEAVPAIQKVLASCSGVEVRRPVATALLVLGVKEAIPVLVEIVETGAGGVGFHDGWQYHTAAETLNRVVGRRVYVGRYLPGGGRGGNLAEAAKVFRKFWEEKGEKLTFDRKTQSWRVP